MEKIGEMEFYTLDEIKDKHVGKPGTPLREAYEREMAEELQALRMGEAIRNARLRQNLTQEQLGERIGVKRAQVSRIENGRNLTFATIARVFKALGISASFDLAGIGKVALW